MAGRPNTGCGSPVGSSRQKGQAEVRLGFDQRLDALEATLLRMALIVQSQLEQAVESLRQLNGPLANLVIEQDDLLDQLHVEVQEETLCLLAMGPGATPALRLLAAALQINTHLERMGDLCANIAKFVASCLPYPPPPHIRATLTEMGSNAQRMLAAAITCFARRDLELAHQLPLLDQPLDRLNSVVFRQVESAFTIEQGAEWISRLVLVSRFFERLGDHSVDIGEQVVFIITGTIGELVPPKAARSQAQR